ncbi:MAG: uncharacterized protein QOF77_132 [Solirubrobacteraceae bacterium]|jgi:uncharacterized protein YcbX|nr:uncharacterized protein [Solirubrobacteraceae bacterium]
MSATTPRVAGLAATPVKGLRLLARQELTLASGGVVDDRRFYLIDEAGRMVNGKQLGALSAVIPDYDAAAGTLALAFPGRPTVTGHVELGPVLATRFHSRPAEARLVLGPWSAAVSEHAGRELRLVTGHGRRPGVDRGRAGAVTLVSRASLDRLAEDTDGARQVDVRRFRMTIELDGPDAHAEDGWVGRRLRVGEALVAVRGHVGRCLVTTRDPDTGEVDLPVLDLLRGYRSGLATTEPLAFGVYAEVIEPGKVRVADPVALL